MHVTVEAAPAPLWTESVSLERESEEEGKAQQAGTMHSTRVRKERRNLTSRPQSTEVGVSMMWRGPLCVLPKSIIVLILITKTPANLCY